jgi:hypothetical protein
LEEGEGKRRRRRRRLREEEEGRRIQKMRPDRTTFMWNFQQ